ncbi:MAG: hypothetical protein JSS43_17500 [Proteobacteria bacterium]|nr:hypothetical protein [Pseudomonadota bacterium]
MHESNLFVTPTYSDEHLPADLSVDPRVHQLFVKRVRKRFGAGIRFFGCGEYGDRSKRPHYHTIFFGLSLPDLQHWKQTPSGSVMFRSAELEKVWPYGQILVQQVDAGTGGYVARYTTKKIYGERAEDHYRRSRVDPSTGQEVSWQVKPEFLLMSRRPGIGAEWVEQYQCDVFPSGFVTVDGTKRPPPRFYVERLPELDREAFLAMRRAQALADARNNPDEHTERRVLQLHQFGEYEAARHSREMDEGG